MIVDNNWFMMILECCFDKLWYIEVQKDVKCVIVDCV